MLALICHEQHRGCKKTRHDFLGYTQEGSLSEGSFSLQRVRQASSSPESKETLLVPLKSEGNPYSRSLFGCLVGNHSGSLAWPTIFCRKPTAKPNDPKPPNLTRRPKPGFRTRAGGAYRLGVLAYLGGSQALQEPGDEIMQEPQ